jgi:hypothetical protein
MVPVLQYKYHDDIAYEASNRYRHHYRDIYGCWRDKPVVGFYEYEDCYAEEACAVYDRCEKAHPLVAVGGPVIRRSFAYPGSDQTQPQRKGIGQDMAGIA